ncbi:MAG: flagellar basal body L-ring protein FlgH [Candidatus Goldbacteria bacterium]|nr:flagellar basal body L-ring protein FlgH [Candidatus Goldiibacteriota bacterium]
MKKKIFFIVISIGLIFLSGGFTIADDLVSDPNDTKSLYADHKALKVGDVLTVIIVESVSGSQEATLQTNKNQSMGGGMGMSVWSGGRILAFPNSWGIGGAEYQDGGGKSKRKGSIIGKISVRVEKVLSNGLLQIRGSKVIKVNDEKQNLVLSGTVRQQDINADNTVLSTYVADAQIEFEGYGPIGEKTSPGILTRILDWLGIF